MMAKPPAATAFPRNHASASEDSLAPAPMTASSQAGSELRDQVLGWHLRRLSDLIAGWYSALYHLR
jgi:hypothetical protein